MCNNNQSTRKVCTKCSQEKPLEDFSKNGYKSQCRVCINEQRRKCRKDKLYSTMTEDEIIEYERNSKLTKEERKKIKVEKKRIYDKNRRNNRTKEQKRQDHEKVRIRKLNRTEEQKHQDREKARIRKLNRTEKQKQQDREKERIRKLNRTEEQKHQDREKKRIRKLNRTEEQKQHDKEVMRLWRDRNSEHVKEYYKKYNKKNKGAFKEKYNNDSLFKLTRNLRVRMGLAIKEGVGFKSGKSEELIGGSFEKAREHIENQFTEGMNWDNHGLYGWHIDHIKPCSAFDLTDPEEQKKCFHYSNLQPLWAYDNLSKNDKWDEEDDILVDRRYELFATEEEMNVEDLFE